MNPQPDLSDILYLLADDGPKYRSAYFDNMPPVTLTLGDEEEFKSKRIEARYKCGVRIIEFSPGFLLSAWKGKGWDKSRLRDTYLHELDHAWVDWKGVWTSDAEGHKNEWFLWKAHRLGLNLYPTRSRWPEVVPLHEEIKRGWNPNFMSLGEWREFAAALEGWDSKSWENLLSDIRVVERVEEKVPGYAWPAFVGELSGAYPFVSDYKLMKDVKASVPADLMYWVAYALEEWNTPVYELIKDLRGRGKFWLTNLVAVWRDAIWHIRRWEGASAQSVLNEVESLRDEEQEEIAAVVNRCAPLRELLARVKQQVYDEIDWAKREAEHCGVGCSDDWDNLEHYSEPNYSFYSKHLFDTYTFENFCKLCAV